MSFTPLPIHEQHQLVVDNMPLVFYLANGMAGGLPLEERVAEGKIALCIAATKFDPKFGVKFGSYAGYWIRQRILQAAAKAQWIPDTNNARKVFWRLRSTIRRLEFEGIEPTNEAIADRLGLTSEAVEAVRGLVLHGMASLDRQLENVDRGRRDIECGMATENAEDEYASVDGERKQSAAIKRALDKLHPRERAVVEQRYLSDDPKTLQELGERMGVCRERIRQIETKALRKMRASLKSLKAVE